MAQRVLIADKDQAVLELVAARLIPRNYEVLAFDQSEEVLRCLNRERVDLIILSTEMERVGGKHLVEKIRDKHHMSVIPILMLAKEDEIAELILSYERGFDDFLIKPFSPLAFQLRVALNIGRMRVRAEANALTQLPGNIAIEKAIRSKIQRDEKFSVLYIDVNHFKSFNDCYGFEKGDNVIRQTAKLLLQIKDKLCPNMDCFIGHIGGDDFVVVLDPKDEEKFAYGFITEFDRIIPTYYAEEDQKNGFIRVKNRRGKPQTFPLMSCSVAAVTNLHRRYQSLGEISQDVSEVKSFLKSQSQPGSHYLRDRRAAPIKQIDQAVELLATKTSKRKKDGLVEPLGKILLNAGLISESDLSRAIKKHMLTGQRLGQTLIAMNLVKSEDVGRMLEKKLNVPYISLRHFTPSRETLRLFTIEFMKTHRVIPLETIHNNLKLAMCDPFDLKAADTIERISGLKPIPCLALEDEFEEFLETHIQEFEHEQVAG
ncbi:MAG: response regulator [Candidatus Omnitrophica bacterium]|nr:response regulator [Candidatus Omnitrophota bacterium]MDD5671686.1 response regulator [Candidatus Omnitrophota bacterium]